MSALEAALMNNPFYAAAYTFAMDETRAAQRDVEVFQDEVNTALSTIDTKINGMLDSAVTLPNGDKAFMDKDGVAWTINGERVDDAIAAGIDWTGTTSREEYNLTLEQQERLEQLAQRGRVMADTIGGNLNRLQDEDGKSSPDKLKAIGTESQDISAETRKLTDEIREIVKPDASISLDQVAPSTSMVPTLE